MDKPAAPHTPDYTPLYLLAREVGDEDPQEYRDNCPLDDEDDDEDFRDREGHCSRCCEHRGGEHGAARAACSGCPGKVHSRDVSDEHGYGEQTESWYIRCPLCGEVDEFEDDGLACMRAAEAISYAERLYSVRDVIPDRLREVASLLGHPARFLLSVAESLWESDEPFAPGLLLLAALLDGAPVDEVRSALTGAPEPLSRWSASRHFRSNLHEVDTPDGRVIGELAREKAAQLSAAGAEADAAWLRSLIVELNWLWEE
jgi:hypothetical protein